MKHLLALMALCVAFAAGAQSSCPEPLDFDSDGLIGVPDLLNLLSYFGEEVELVESYDWMCGDDLIYHGDTYETVQIGYQCWMSQNLRTVQFANGDSIAEAQSSAEWVAASGTPVQRPHAGSSYPPELFGRFYSGSCVLGESQLCPTGWHVPTDLDWRQLEVFVGMDHAEADSTGWRGGEEGIGAILRSSSSDTPSWNGSNDFGFSAVGPGWIVGNGGFSNSGLFGFYWTQTVHPNGWPMNRWFFSAQQGLLRGAESSISGMSVRCIKD